MCEHGRVQKKSGLTPFNEKFFPDVRGFLIPFRWAFLFYRPQRIQRESWGRDWRVIYLVMIGMTAVKELMQYRQWLCSVDNMALCTLFRFGHCKRGWWSVPEGGYLAANMYTDRSVNSEYWEINRSATVYNTFMRYSSNQDNLPLLVSL